MKMTVMLVVVPARQAQAMVDKFPGTAKYWASPIESERLDYLEYFRHAGVVAAEQLWKFMHDEKREAG